VLEPGRGSHFGEHIRANHVHPTATLDAATWGAEPAVGEGPGRICRVEPAGPYEDDPHLTDQRFPGNPTRSHRTRVPLRVIAGLEVNAMADGFTWGRGGSSSVPAS
jgi:rifampin ADP-ribosylating transferase